MPLVTTKDMFQKAYQGGYAIGAFNVNNMEIVQAITEAAQLEQAPVILQVSAGARKYAKHIYLVKLVEAAVADTTVPIALHLDHGDGFEICKDCIDGGFTSVMIDGSKFSFEDNIAVTRKVVEYAHERGVMVEGELGKLAGIEDAVGALLAEGDGIGEAHLFQLVDVAGAEGADGLAVHDHLTAAVAGGLEEHRIHPHVRLQPRRLRLRNLCPTHLESIAGDEGIERHILGFEWRTGVAVLTENAAQRRHKKALPGV